MTMKKILQTAVLVMAGSFAMAGCTDYTNIEVTKYPDYWETPTYASSMAIGPVENNVWERDAYTYFESYLIDEFSNSSMTIYDRTRDYKGYSHANAVAKERDMEKSADLYFASEVTEFSKSTEKVIVEEVNEYYLTDDWGYYIYDEYGEPIIMEEIIEYEQFQHTGTAELKYYVYDVETSEMIHQQTVRRSWTAPQLTNHPDEVDLDSLMAYTADEVIFAVADQNLPYNLTLKVEKGSTLKVASSYEEKNKDGMVCKNYPSDSKIQYTKEPVIYLAVKLPEEAQYNQFMVDIIQRTGEKEKDESISTPALFLNKFIWENAQCDIIAIPVESENLYSDVTLNDGKAELMARLWSSSALIHTVKFELTKD